MRPGEFDADNTVALSLHQYTRRIGLGDDETSAVLAKLDVPDSPVGATAQHANYLGRIIAEVAEWDYSNSKIKKDIRSIIEQWTKAKLIKQSVFKPSGGGNMSRRSVAVYVRGETIFNKKPDVFGAVNDEDENDGF